MREVVPRRRGGVTDTVSWSSAPSCHMALAYAAHGRSGTGVQHNKRTLLPECLNSSGETRRWRWRVGEGVFRGCKAPQLGGELGFLSALVQE
mmetsp:Transcript_11962/g.31290  ORF Transcript_11962/g.31290 Transcript_11962/m.31290 type:complete len:92 (-) Transcript_11962:808-1083(-)